MSSEESDDEDATILHVKALQWERRKLKSLKKKVKILYMDGLSAVQKRKLKKRIVDRESTRKVPDNAPEWAARVDRAEVQ